MTKPDSSNRDIIPAGFRFAGLQRWTASTVTDVAIALAFASRPGDIGADLLQTVIGRDGRSADKVEAWTQLIARVVAARHGLADRPEVIEAAAADALAIVCNRRAGKNGRDRAFELGVRKGPFLDLRGGIETLIRRKYDDAIRAYLGAFDAREPETPRDRQSRNMETTPMPMPTDTPSRELSPVEVLRALHETYSGWLAAVEADVLAVLAVLAKIAGRPVEVLVGIDEAAGYPILTVARHRGGLLFALEPTRPVENGDLQAAGWIVIPGIDDFDFAGDDHPAYLVARIRLTNGDVVPLRFRRPGVCLIGDYDQEREYEADDAVLHAEGMWRATRPTGGVHGHDESAWEPWWPPTTEEHRALLVAAGWVS